MIYYSLLFWFFLMSFTKSKKILISSFLISALSLGLTYGHGYDWINYSQIYSDLKYENSDVPFEYGYYYAMKLFYYFSAPYSLFHFSITICIFYLIYTFCKKTLNPNLSFFVMFSFAGYFLFMEQMRQGLAISIVALSIFMVPTKQYVRFTVMILLATMFHFTAIFGFLYLVLTPKNQFLFKTKYLIASSLVIFSVMFIYFNPGIVSFIPALELKINLYKAQEQTLINSIFFLSSILYLILAAVVFLMKYHKPDNKESLMIDGAVCSALFMYQTKIAFLLQRVQYYAVPSLIYGTDRYFYRIGPISIFRIMYVVIILAIGLMPLRYEIYRNSLTSFLTITSDKYQIRDLIEKRCYDLRIADPENTVIKECMNN